MPEASAALCAGLLGARALRFLRQQGSWGSALTSAKRGVQQLAEETEGAAAEAAAAAVGVGRGAVGQPAPPRATQQQQWPRQQEQQQEQQRTPVAPVLLVPTVSPLIERGAGPLQGLVGRALGCRDGWKSSTLIQKHDPQKHGPQ